MNVILSQTLQKAQSLDEFLDSYHFSKKQKHRLKMEKRIQVNQRLCMHNISLQKGDHIDIDCEEEEKSTLEGYETEIEILYEDEIVLVVNKPIHMIIHGDEKTLDQAVSYYYQKTHQNHPVLHVHRLDRDTSGCILYCKNSFFLPYFDHALKEKQIKRTYLAIVEGEITSSMTLNQKIGKDRHANRYRVSKTGMDAVTHVKPLRHDHHQTLIECELETGRTHQIRVHLSSIHHPLVGDELYGKKDSMRCALHSHTLTFVHPITLKKIQITSPMPQDMHACMKI